MDKKFEDFEPVNPKAIEELRPSMPQPDVLLDLSEFFKVMGLSLIHIFLTHPG